MDIEGAEPTTGLRPPPARRIRLAARSVTDRLLDTVIGIESAGGHAGVSAEDCRFRGYQASYWLALAVGMRGLRLRPDEAFMDLGCGKGRVLYLASWYRFARVIGVELDPGMSALARANLTRARGPARLRRAEVVEQDARAVALPDRLRVVFLFNPFVGEVFRVVAGRLAEHAGRTGTPLRIIYANPVEAAVLRELGFTAGRGGKHCTVFDYSAEGR